MYVLLEDDLGRLAVRPLRPWHRVAARARAGRLDLRLACGDSPEASPLLAARAMFLTSARARCQLAASLRRILAASGPEPARQPRMPLRRDQIARSAAGLAQLAGSLAGQDPVPARGVAMVTRLLADGRGPLYRACAAADLDAVIDQAARALAG